MDPFYTGPPVFVITNASDYAVMDWGYRHGMTQGQLRVIREPHFLRGVNDLVVARIIAENAEIPDGVHEALTVAQHLVAEGRARWFGDEAAARPGEDGRDG